MSMDTEVGAAPRRARKAPKANGKATEKVAKAKTPKEPKAPKEKKIRVDEAELKIRLKEGGHKFGSRTSLDKLIDLAKANDVEVPELKTGGNVVPKTYRERYGKEQTCGDDMANALKSYVTDKDGKCDPEKLAKVASDNGVDLGRWANANIGMQRMNLGNVLRGMVNRHQKVKVGSAKFHIEADEGSAAKGAKL